MGDGRIAQRLPPPVRRTVYRKPVMVMRFIFHAFPSVGILFSHFFLPRLYDKNKEKPVDL